MLICTIFGTLFSLLWILCYLRGKGRFDRYIQVLDPDEYMFCELFYIGFAAMELFRINVKSTKGNNNLRTQLAALYGDQNIEFYLYIITGGQYTYIITMAAVGLLMGVVGNKPLIGLLLALIGLGFSMNLPQKVEENYKKREEEMQMQLPNVISTMALLINAGMGPQQCWEKVSKMGDSAVYKTMQEATRQLNNGVSLAEAVQYMGDHSGSKEIRKFCSAFRTNLKKGDAELADTLLRMNEESWNNKKELAKQRGELASQKLLLPTMMMFIGLMAMIILPVFSNMNM